MITVTLAKCHDTCLDVAGPDDHVANINPIGGTNPAEWRVDCDGCGTCVQANILDKATARSIAMQHVVESSEEFWRKYELNRS